MNYALVDIKTGEAVQNFMGDIPGMLIWPNGDATYAVSPGEERDGFRFVSVLVRPDRPSEFHDLRGTESILGEHELVHWQDWQPGDIERVRAVLNGRIDADAETERLKYITPGTGQALTYYAKLIEAQAFTRDSSVGEYPLLAASTPVGSSVKETAASVIAASSAWTEAASRIEKVRLDAKARIVSALTVEEAMAIASAIKWEG